MSVENLRSNQTSLGVLAFERAAVLIHGPDLSDFAHDLNFEPDFARLQAIVASSSQMVRMTFYAAVAPDGDVSIIRPLLDWLDYNGYEVKQIFRGNGRNAQASRLVDGIIEVEMTVGAFGLAAHIQHLFIIGRGAHLRSAISALQLRGVKVSLISTLRAGDRNVCDAARRQADNFIELDDLKPFIARHR